MSQSVLDALKARFGAAILETHSNFGDDTAVVASDSWKAIGAFLRDDPAMSFELFVDLCGVDYPERTPRFDVVLHLYSVTHAHRIRVKARIGDDEGNHAKIDSLTSLWRGADWLERETFDMFGIKFEGHPDLRRILMYPEFTGFPLRKDYPAQKTEPLIAYRTEEEAGLPLGKLEPFGPDEGMSFGRKVWDTHGTT